MKTRFEKVITFIPLITNQTKLVISSFLVLLALILCYVFPDAMDRKLCLLAMMISFLGDAALNCMPLEKRPHSLLYTGAGFFMIAHLAYAFSYYLMIKQESFSILNHGAFFAIVFIVTLFMLTTITVVRTNQIPNKMVILVFSLYTLVIGINFVTICSYSYSFGSISFIGARSFLISDFIIGIETLFKIKSDTLRKLVWIFYPIGQVLIIVCR